MGFELGGMLDLWIRRGIRWEKDGCGVVARSKRKKVDGVLIFSNPFQPLFVVWLFFVTMQSAIFKI